MEIVGYLASILIGVSLGLIGGGGSILTVPVLVYLFGIDAVTSTAYSLFIVGVTSMVGSVSYFRKKLVNIKTAIIFGIPSIIAVYATRAYIVPAIPDQILTLGSFTLEKNAALLLLFALLMIVASYSMIKKSQPQSEEKNSGPQQFNYPLILIEGAVVGVLTGLVGAGGGFLIIPALVVLSKLPMKEAVGTSLVIISAKSILGFTGDASANMDWNFLLLITLFAIVGIILGFSLSKKVDGKKLKPAFGWFVLVMGIYIILKELL